MRVLQNKKIKLELKKERVRLIELKMNMREAFN